MCGDATNWEEDSYRESILKEREIKTLTVFRTAWPPSPTATVNPDVIVSASSDGSVASYSLSSCISKLPLGFGSAKPPQAEPNGFLWAHDGPAYDVKFYGNGEENALLLSCGDDGWIRGWRWNEFAESEIAEVVSVLAQLVQRRIRIQKDHPLLLAALLLMQAFTNGRSLSIWSLATSERVSRISTRAPIQDVMFTDNQILAVGAESVLSRFDMNGTILSQIPCATQSALSVSLHPSGVMAVGGYGGLVDIISQFWSHYCTFRCRCA